MKAFFSFYFTQPKLAHAPISIQQHVAKSFCNIIRTVQDLPDLPVHLIAFFPAVMALWVMQKVQEGAAGTSHSQYGWREDKLVFYTRVRMYKQANNITCDTLSHPNLTPPFQ